MNLFLEPYPLKTRGLVFTHRLHTVTKQIFHNESLLRTLTAPTNWLWNCLRDVRITNPTSRFRTSQKSFDRLRPESQTGSVQSHFSYMYVPHESLPVGSEVELPIRQLTSRQFLPVFATSRWELASWTRTEYFAYPSILLRMMRLLLEESPVSCSVLKTQLKSKERGS